MSGFDDLFDDGMFRSAQNNSTRRHPDMETSGSVSDMRKHTTYGLEKMSHGPSRELSDVEVQRHASHTQGQKLMTQQKVDSRAARMAPPSAGGGWKWSESK